MVMISFNNLSEENKTKAIEKLISNSTPDKDFFFMTVLSVLMATFGILIDNLTVIIGSMLIAPLLSPILSLALGVIISDSLLLKRSVQTIFKSMWISILSAIIITLLFSVGTDMKNIIESSQPSFLYMGVAIIAGFAATFALVKPKLNETLPGAAIAVALIPPLALIGVGLAKLNWLIVTNAFLIFILNMIGIVFASMITFSLMNFYVKRNTIRKTIVEEDEKLEKEKDKNDIISKV